MARKPIAESSPINHDSPGSRLTGLLASLLFSVPTAAIIWFALNVELGLNFDRFLGSAYLYGLMLLFALLALIFPRLFPEILGMLWRAMLSWFRFWY